MLRFDPSFLQSRCRGASLGQRHLSCLLPRVSEAGQTRNDDDGRFGGAEGLVPHAELSRASEDSASEIEAQLQKTLRNQHQPRAVFSQTAGSYSFIEQIVSRTGTQARGILVREQSSAEEKAEDCRNLPMKAPARH